MTAPRPVRRRISPANTAPSSPVPPPPAASLRNEHAQPARRENPDTPRRRRANKNEEPSFAQPSFEELDRWDEEWRGEWDRGDVDDSAAYEDELDVAEQSRDVEWLLDALDALDDNGRDDDAFDWEE
jgi:hypothetical protein